MKKINWEKVRLYSKYCYASTLPPKHLLPSIIEQWILTIVRYVVLYICTQAPDYDAKQSSAVWHGAGEERVKVTVSETHIETFFCQKNEGTDGKFSGKPKKVHLC